MTCSVLLCLSVCKLASCFTSEPECMQHLHIPNTALWMASEKYFLSTVLQNYLIHPESPHLREINPRFDHKGRNALQSAAQFDPQLNH